MKRTFFTVNVGESTVAQRYTGEDLSQALRVERVDARLSGRPLDYTLIADNLEGALEAASAFVSMRQAVRLTSGAIAGPFIVLSEHVPTDEQLITHWRGPMKGVRS